MNEEKINIVITGVSFFSLSVSATRVKNLFNPLILSKDIAVKNLIITSPQMENQFGIQPDGLNIKYETINYNLLNILSVFNFIIKSFFIIKRMKQRELKNVLYIYGYPDLRNIFIIIFSKLFNYKTIFDIVEDNFTINNYKSLKGRLRNYSSLLFVKKISLTANGAIAISTHLKKQLEKFSAKKIPIELIPISVDFNNFSSIKAKSNCEIKLFYGGSFGEKDGIDLLLEAFEKVSKLFNNIKLVMTGRGADRYMNNFYRIIEKNTAKNNIIFKGFLPVKEYYNAVTECDILCAIRSKSAFANGGFPFKLGEYLASGKAVIVSDVSDVSYYIKDKINGILVKPSSLDDLVKAMVMLISNTDLRIKIGEEGRKTAKKFFDNYLVAEKFFTFIKNIVQ